MKKVITLAIALILTLTLAACDGGSGGGKPSGTYSGIGGDEYVFSGNDFDHTMSGAPLGGGTFKISGNKLTLTIQGATVSATYDKDRDIINIGGAEYTKNGSGDSTGANNSGSASASGNSEAGEVTNTAPEDTAAPLVDLGLPLTVTETTYKRQSFLVTTNGDLYAMQSSGNEIEDLIDTNVRSAADAYDGQTKLYIKNDNSLWAVGHNGNGVLGDGTGVKQDKPVKIMEDVATIYVEGYHVYAIKTDKTLWIWGGFGAKPLYEPTFACDDVVQVSESIVPGYTDLYIVIQLSSGRIYWKSPKDLGSEPQNAIETWTNLADGHSCYDFIGRLNGAKNPYVQCFIDEQKSLHMVENTDIGYVTIAEDVERVYWKGLSGNGYHFIKTDGSLWAYGKNSDGQLGDGTKIDRDEPVKIADDVLATCAYTYINGARFANAFAYIKTNGEIWTWDESNPTPEKTDDVVFWGDKVYKVSDLPDDIKTPNTVVFP